MNNKEKNDYVGGSISVLVDVLFDKNRSPDIKDYTFSSKLLRNIMNECVKRGNCMAGLKK